MTDDSDALRRLRTEQSRPELAALDTAPTRELVTLLAQEQTAVHEAVTAAGDAIAAAVDAIVGRLEAGGRLVYVGAGTPGRLGVLDAAECLPTFGVDPGRIVGVIAGGRAAMTRAVEDAEDAPDDAARDLADLAVDRGDAVVGITASGRTPYVLGAVTAAARIGAVTIGVTNNAGARLSALVDHPVEVDTGPELVAGSTRMKAGTAQKLVLNALSTAAMIRLGKTYGNLMVDLVATNEKLRHRARRIVAEASGVSERRAAAALDAADGQVKTAIVMLRAGVAVAEARARLTRARGHVRVALDGAGPASAPATDDPAQPDGGDR